MNKTNSVYAGTSFKGRHVFRVKDGKVSYTYREKEFTMTARRWIEIVCKIEAFESRIDN